MYVLNLNGAALGRKVRNEERRESSRVIEEVMQCVGYVGAVVYKRRNGKGSQTRRRVEGTRRGAPEYTRGELVTDDK